MTPTEELGQTRVVAEQAIEIVQDCRKMLGLEKGELLTEAVAALRAQMATRTALLDYLDDFVDGDDLLFRVAVSPDMYRSELGRYEEVTVCYYGAGKETATDALQRFAKERGDTLTTRIREQEEL